MDKTSERSGSPGLGRVFLRGLVILVPITVTLYILYWIGMAVETSLGGILKLLIPNQYYIPGMGLASGLTVVLLTGLLANEPAMRALSRRAEKLITHLPVVNIIYGATQDVVGYIQKGREGNFNQVVMASVGEPPRRVIGFVTRDDFSDVPPGVAEDGMVAVYFPMSYQVGGYTMMIRQSELQPIDVSVKDAMRFTLTAGMSTMKSGGEEETEASPVTSGP